MRLLRAGLNRERVALAPPPPPPPPPAPPRPPSAPPRATPSTPSDHTYVCPGGPSFVAQDDIVYEADRCVPAGRSLLLRARAACVLA